MQQDSEEETYRIPETDLFRFPDILREALRHLIAVAGVSQIMLGTDFPYPWTTTSVDHVLSTPGLTDVERIAILGGNAAKLFGIAS